MKKRFLKAIAVITALTSINCIMPITSFAAIETRPVVLKGEGFYSKWKGEYYEQGSAGFAQDMYEEIFGHEYTEYTTKKLYSMSGLERIYLNGKYGDMIVFKKGNDSASMILKEADQKTMTFYEAAKSSNKYQVMEKERRYDADDPHKFMNGRFEGGYFTVYRSEKYDEANHKHRPNIDGYCVCGSYDGRELIDADFEIYMIKATTVRELPYAAAQRKTVLKVSNIPDKVKAAAVNGDGEVWYKISDGWVFSEDVGLEMSSNITKPDIFEGFTAIVSDIDKLPVYSYNNDDAYSVLGYVEEGKPVSVTKVLPNWYIIDFDGRDGYIKSKFAEPLKVMEKTAEEITE